VVFRVTGDIVVVWVLLFRRSMYFGTGDQPMEQESFELDKESSPRLSGVNMWNNINKEFLLADSDEENSGMSVT